MTQLTHAQTINGRYLKSTSHFVTLQQRLNDALKAASNVCKHVNRNG